MDQQRSQMRRPATTHPEVEQAVPRLKVPMLRPNVEGIGRSLPPELPQNDSPEAVRPPRSTGAAQEVARPMRRSTAGHGIRNIRTSRTALRQAIVMNEILGPPLVLREIKKG